MLGRVNWRGGYLLVLTTALACSSSQQSEVAPSPASVSRVFIPGGSGTSMTNEAGFGTRSVPAPIDSVWALLPAVYTTLGIEDPRADEQQRAFGRMDFRARRIEGKRLSTYLDCGIGATAVPHADDYQVTMSIWTRLSTADDGNTIAATTVEATAKPRAVSGNPVFCQSKGELEKRTADLIVWHLVRNR